MEQVRYIPIDLYIKPSKELGRKLMTVLIDYLLHSRSQIPFHFELFKLFVENKGNKASEKPDWKKERQLKLAAETYTSICALKQLVESEFTAGAPLLVIFGSTVYTAKEAYEILFPEVNESILPTLVNETSLIKTILLKIIQNNASDLTVMPPTNVFILFKRYQPIEDHPELTELKNFKLSKSCRKISIHFRDSSDFKILEDFNEEFQELNLNETSSNNVEVEHEIWYQSRTFVKGFKDILVNNKSIWN